LVMSGFLKWASDVLDQVDDNAANVAANVLNRQDGAIEGQPPSASSPEEVSTTTTPNPDTDQHQPLDSTSQEIESTTTSPNSNDPPEITDSVLAPSLPAPAKSPGSPAVPEEQELPSDTRQLRAKLREALQEVSSLRAVWNETRESLSRAKKLLLQQEDQHRKSLKEKQKENTAALADQAQDFMEEISKMKTTIAQNQMEFEGALTAKSAFRAESEKDLREINDKLSAAVAEVEEWKQKAAAAAAEKEHLISRHQETAQQHARVLDALRAEARERETKMEQRSAVLSDQVSQFRERELDLRDNTSSSVADLAKLEQQLEDRTRELSRVQATTQYYETEISSARSEVQFLQKRLASEKQSSEQAEAGLRDKLSQLQLRLDAANKQISEQATAATHNVIAIKDLQTQLQLQQEDSSGKKFQELEARCAALTDHYSAQLERLGSEKCTLKLQLEDANQQNKALTAEVERLRTNTGGSSDAEDEELGGRHGLHSTGLRRTGRRNHGDSHGDGALGGFVKPGGIGMSIQSRTVREAVGFLDNLGIYVGQLLRRHPAARLVFAVYVILIHLWVVFVMYHFTHHIQPDDTGLGSAVAINLAGQVSEHVLAPGSTIKMPAAQPKPP